MKGRDQGEERVRSAAPFGRICQSGSQGRLRQLLVLLGALVLVGSLALVQLSPPAQQPAPAVAAKAGSTAQPTLEVESGFLSAYPEPRVEQKTLDPPNLLDIFAKLLVVLALAWLAAGALRRFLGGTTGQTGRGLIRLVESSYLGPRRSLHLISVADRTFLVGATDQQVTLLSQWTETALGAKPAESPRAAEGSPTIFGHHLTVSLEQPNALGSSSPALRARACLAQLRTRVDALGGAGRIGDQP